MLHTAEIRWILAGELPPAVDEWFRSDRPLDQAHRVDRYLVFPKGVGERVGVKLREGRLEIKVRQGAGEVRDLGRGVRGTLERWVKRSLPAPSRDWLRPVETSDPWVAVGKTRCQRLFQVRDGAVREVSVEAGAELGCAVELGRLDLHGHPWWTLAVEASGEPAGASAAAVAVARHLLSLGAPAEVRLAESDSRSYPEWLAGAVD